MQLGTTLDIVKLDRLSRNARFLLGLQEAGVMFMVVDMPTANDLTMDIMALVAQEERKAIPVRTKTAIAAAKERGVTLDFPKGAVPFWHYGNELGIKVVKRNADEQAGKLADVVKEIQTKEVSRLKGIAELSRMEVATDRGGLWYASSTKSLLAQLAR